MSERILYPYNSNVTNDSQKSIGISIIFQKPQVFNNTYTTKEQVKSQLINYILTNPGERFFNPNFGSGIRALLFEQSVDVESLGDVLKQKIELFVQNITVNNVTVVEGDSNQINISINYSINRIQDNLLITLDNQTI